MANIKKTDHITSTHRRNSYTIDKGADLKRMMAEIFRKSMGWCHGKCDSMHIVDFSISMLEQQRRRQAQLGRGGRPKPSTW